MDVLLLWPGSEEPALYGLFFGVVCGAISGQSYLWSKLRGWDRQRSRADRQ